MFISDNVLIKSQFRQCGRVVKALASKANGFSRAGSNPAVVGLFTQRKQTDNYLILPQFNLDELSKGLVSTPNSPYSLLEFYNRVLSSSICIFLLFFFPY